MTRLINALSALTLLAITILSASCHRIEEYADDPQGNFEALWTIIDEHYCFLDEKGIDWDAVHDTYARRIGPEMTREELFIVCADMLDELKDGHVNLSAPFNTSYYRKWWSDYPQNFSERLIEESYFNFNYRQTGGMKFGILSENIGYIYYSSFSNPVGEGNLDNVIYFLKNTQGLIIDVRDNGGGNLTVVDKLVSQFIDQTITAGYICHKTGPGHDDFSRPFAYTIEPATGHVRWLKPVVVLTNRSTFSAANNFVSIMKSRKNTAIVGDITGGGSGMPFSSELPCGWGIRFSASPVYDADMNLTENGVEPSRNCRIDMNPAAEARGRDSIVDFAIALIKASVKPAS